MFKTEGTLAAGQKDQIRAIPLSTHSSAVEQRQRRDSALRRPADPETISAVPIRPQLVTYTSFESAFGVGAPRTPEGSPTKIKSWWSRGT
jgi:hypothetical protein